MSGDAVRAPRALVDMDETLCDYSGAIAAGLARLRGPREDPKLEDGPNPPAHIAARKRLITAVPGFWRNLAPLRSGFDVLDILISLGFDTYIVTKGPAGLPSAWTEKVEWCREHAPGLPLVVADHKEVVAGDVLVEDWPPYIERWLERCPQGLVVVPATPWNSDWCLASSLSIRYDGTNLNSVRERLHEVVARFEEQNVDGR